MSIRPIKTYLNIRKMKTKLLPTLTVAFFAAASAVNALTFDLAWSGATYGNNATATGSITVDEALFTTANNTAQPLDYAGNFFPGSTSSNWVTDFEITVSGSTNGSGNGTFTFTDYDNFVWQTPSPLDLSQELVGQNVTVGSQWGNISTLPGATGDFNIVSNGMAPTAATGIFFFQIATEGGSGDQLALTSFKRVPDEGISMLGLLGIGLATLGSFTRRKKA